MSEIERRLYEVLNLVETNQAAVQVAMDGLAAERTALRQERTALALQVTDLQVQMKAVVEAAVKQSLAGAAGQVVDEVKAKTDALDHNVGVMTNSVADAEFALEGLIKWASGRLLLAAATILVVLGVGGWVVSAGVQWWDEKAIASAQAEKAELQQDVANLQANKAIWVQEGMLDKIERCGSDNRPCVEVDENAGQFGPQGGPYDLRVLKGY